MDLYTLQKQCVLPISFSSTLDLCELLLTIANYLSASLSTAVQYEVVILEENCSDQNGTILFHLTLSWPFYSVTDSGESEDLLLIVLLLSKDFIYTRYIVLPTTLIVTLSLNVTLCLLVWPMRQRNFVSEQVNLFIFGNLKWGFFENDCRELRLLLLYSLTLSLLCKKY